MDTINNKHCRKCATKLCCFCIYNSTKYDTNEHKREYSSVWKFNY